MAPKIEFSGFSLLCSGCCRPQSHAKFSVSQHYSLEATAIGKAGITCFESTGGIVTTDTQSMPFRPLK